MAQVITLTSLVLLLATLLMRSMVKFQGATNSIAYGISYFETGDDHNDADKGINGYIGLEQEVFNVYAGYEVVMTMLITKFTQ